MLRHDIDYNLTDAVTFAQFERKINVVSTYFIMLTNNFYNVFSLKGSRQIKEIQECGHEVGLHFDEYRYPDVLGKTELVKEKIVEETQILSHITGKPVTKVSMHRPSKEIIQANLNISCILNTYDNVFFYEFKYLSDSRRRWREPVEDIVKEKQVDKFQILVHPFWYADEEMEIRDRIECFVNGANKERWGYLDENISSLSDIMPKEYVMGVK